MALPEVLVVDDDVTAIQLIQHILSGEARVRFARSGEDGLAQARLSVPDLILLDIDMPGMGGVATCRALKAERRTADVPVIFITRFGDEASELAALDAGASDFMSKPLTAVKVLARVRALWRVRQQLQHVLHRSPDLPLLPEQGAAPRLLVVDDDPLAQEVLHQALAATGAQLEFATGGAQALDRVIETAPDLLLLDLVMPGIDGWQVLAALQATGALRHTPVIAITRLLDEDCEAQALASGATDFITKPFSPTVLQARVRNVLRLKQQADAALRLEREHWRLLSDTRVAEVVAAVHQAMLVIDARGRVRLANRAARALWPLADDAAGLVGQPLAALWPAVLPLLGAGGDAVQVPAPGDASVPVEVSWSHLGSADERLTTLLVHDLADRRRAEAALREQARLEAERQTRAQMLSFVAHELNNPLAGIVGLARLMLRADAPALDAGQRQRVTLIDQCAQQALGLMRDLLDLHRIEAGLFALALGPVDVAQAVAQALAAVAAQAELAQIALRADEVAAGLSLHADAVRLQQILVNLLGNAVKYNRIGGEVRLAARAVGAGVEISVHDTGLGMTDAQLARLFEPGNRLGREDGQAPGSGLGLVLTRMLVEAMGGTLQVRSTAREGSCFTVCLPVAVQAGS